VIIANGTKIEILVIIKSILTSKREIKMIKGTIKVDGKICKGCELCIVACPQDALALSANFNDKGYRFVELINNVCTGCANCALVCPEAAIEVYREPKPAKKVLQ
jgi:2-oxoglutarate ferredoxin oxidoreductase subunit delta